jgi:hypothetical protein
MRLAVALSDSVVCDVEGGPFYVARFVRTESRKDKDREFFQVIVDQARYDGSRFERSFMYDDFDRDSGEQTDVSLAASLVEPGRVVALRLAVNVSRATNKPWFAVVALHVLPTVEESSAGSPDRDQSRS